MSTSGGRNQQTHDHRVAQGDGSRGHAAGARAATLPPSGFFGAVARCHPGSAPMTADIVRHLGRAAGNSATAAYLQRQAVPVLPAPAPGTTPDTTPQRGTKEYNEAAAKSPTVGKPPPPGPAGVLTQIRKPNDSLPLADLAKGIRWQLGQKSISIPIIFPGVPAGIAIGGRLGAEADVKGEAHARWNRWPAELPQVGTVDNIGLNGALTGGAKVSGGLFVLGGLNSPVVQAALIVGGDVDLNAKGGLTVNGAITRTGDPLANSWPEDWRGHYIVRFNFTGQLIVSANVAFVWRVLWASGEERLFRLGRFVAGEVNAQGTAGFPAAGGAPTINLSLRMVTGAKKAEPVATRPAPKPTASVQTPDGADQNTPTTVATLRIQRRQQPRQGARTPPEE